FIRLDLLPSFLSTLSSLVPVSMLPLLFIISSAAFFSLLLSGEFLGELWFSLISAIGLFSLRGLHDEMPVALPLKSCVSSFSISLVDTTGRLLVFSQS